MYARHWYPQPPMAMAPPVQPLPMAVAAYRPAPRMPMGLPPHLMDGCFSEAQRALLTANDLDALRVSVAVDNGPLMTALSAEMRQTGRFVREVAERSQPHSGMPDYIIIILPSLQHSLMTISKYCADESLTKENRWRTMYHTMSDQGKLPLLDRFYLYNRYLILLNQMLARSANFDIYALNIDRDKILLLRDDQGLNSADEERPELLLGTAPEQELTQRPRGGARDHWATKIFSRSFASRTPLLLGKKRASVVHGRGPGEQVKIPHGSEILFRRTFDDENISVKFYICPNYRKYERVPFIQAADYQDGQTRYAGRGIHELYIRRSGRGLVLHRWSEREKAPIPWLSLVFRTWEEIVLFHCTFVALKITTPLRLNISDDELDISGEKRIFAAKIHDGNYNHFLIALRDESGGIRLHAQALDGDCKGMPVWTAFVTHQSQSPTWLERRSEKLVWLKEIQLYIFCNVYDENKMRQNKYGFFEVNFFHKEAADRFSRLFTPQPPPPPSVMRPSEIHEPSASSTASSSGD